jgi:hypothetical protein
MGQDRPDHGGGGAVQAALWLGLATGVGLVGIELARSVPAWLRVRRRRDLGGVSPVSTGVLAGSATGWMAVAVLTSSWPALVAISVWLVFHLLLCREIGRVDRPAARRVVASAGWTQLAVVVVGAIGTVLGRPAEALGVAIGATTVAYSLPALVAGLTSASTAGLSLPAITVNALEGAVYAAAGLGLGGVSPPGQPVLGYVIAGGAALLANVPRLVRVAIRRIRGLDRPLPSGSVPG